MVMAEPQSKSKFIGKVLFTAVLIGVFIVLVFNRLTIFYNYDILFYLSPIEHFTWAILYCIPGSSGSLLDISIGFDTSKCIFNILGFLVFILISLLLSFIFWKIVDKLRTS